MNILVSDGWGRKASEIRRYRGEIIELRYVEARGEDLWCAGKEKTPLNPGNTYLVRGWHKAWVKIVKGEAPDYIDDEPGKVFPVTRELPDRETSKWGYTRNGKRKDPWSLTEFVYLQGNLSGTEYTFMARFAERRAVDWLCTEIINRRVERPKATPTVRLSTKPDGERNLLPWFEIVEWENDDPAPSAPSPPSPVPPKSAKPVQSETAFGSKAAQSESAFGELNDEIPWKA